jgi:hypothetical protein
LPKSYICIIICLNKGYSLSSQVFISAENPYTTAGGVSDLRERVRRKNELGEVLAGLAIIMASAEIALTIMGRIPHATATITSFIFLEGIAALSLTLSANRDSNKLGENARLASEPTVAESQGPLVVTKIEVFPD